MISKLLRLQNISSFLLCLSSLLLLLDFAPRDILPSYKKQIDAIETLKKSQIVLLENNNSTINYEGNKPKNLAFDSKSYFILSELIKQHSPSSKNIEWERAVGIGYTSLSLPLGNDKIEAFNPLYIVYSPNKQSESKPYAAIGQLQDLEVWMSLQHQGSLTGWALFFLLLGFSLQLASNIKET